MELPLSELTLRKYEKPYQTEKREIVKKICLSLGLLQPGDNRDIIVDILAVLIEAKKDKKELNLDELKKLVVELRIKSNLETKGMADSNIRRQLKRLKDLMLVEKNNNDYRISEFDSISNIFEEKIEKFFIPSIISRIKEYLVEVEK